MKYYHQPPDGSIAGPYTWDELQDMVERHRLSDHALVWRTGEKEWAEFREWQEKTGDAYPVFPPLPDFAPSSVGSGQPPLAGMLPPDAPAPPSMRVDGERSGGSPESRVESDASPLMHYVLFPDGHQEGPFEKQELWQMHARRRLPAGSLFWHDGLPDWAPADRVFTSSDISGWQAAAQRPVAGTFLPYLQDAVRRWRDFSGRTSRRGYWVAIAACFLCECLLMVGNMICQGLASIMPSERAYEFFLLVGALFVLAMLPACLFTIPLTARRLHDTNKSGWLQLIGMIPIGGIVLLVLCCLAGDPHGNMYGRKPDR